jgi:hypothetical protein
VATWAITSFFNPKKFERRYQNYRAFRAALDLPLLTLEWFQRGATELGPEDADIHIALQGGDLMWQKERLLNIALGELPASCDAVVWLDCDVLFAAPDWAARIDAALEHAPIAQLFSEVEHLSPLRGQAPLFARESLAALFRRTGATDVAARIGSPEKPPSVGADSSEAERRERQRLASRPSSGHAWAARRSLLERHGFYDACVCGVGDMAMALAALQRHELFLERFPLNPSQQTHYRNWAEPFAAATGGRVACVTGRLQHLFHGNLLDRQYQSRLRWLSDSGFDPAKHLVPSSSGLWRWHGEFQALDERIDRYFANRSEDAAALESNAAAPPA